MMPTILRHFCYFDLLSMNRLALFCVHQTTKKHVITKRACHIFAFSPRGTTLEGSRHRGITLNNHHRLDCIGNWDNSTF